MMFLLFLLCKCKYKLGMRQTKGGNMVIDHTSAHNLPHLAPSSMGEGELFALLLWCKCFFRIPCLQPYGHADN